MYSDNDLAAMRRVQQVFDPAGRCNPGKIFPDQRHEERAP
jgi:glycolate oxidase